MGERARLGWRAWAAGLGFAAVGIVVAASLLRPAARSQPIPQTVPPNLGFGLSGHANGLRNPFQYSTLSDLSPEWFRLEFDWSLVEPVAPGRRDPAVMRAFRETVDTLAKRGIKVYVLLSQSPSWARHCVRRADGEWDARVPTKRCQTTSNAPPAADLASHWRRFVGDMVREFKPDAARHRAGVTYWAVWNEPNGGQLEVPRGVDPLPVYARLVSEAAPAIHAAGGKVVAPELASVDDFRRPDPRFTTSSDTFRTGVQWLVDFASSGAGLQTDILSVHMYGTANLIADNALVRILGAPEIARGPWRLWVTEANLAATMTDAEQAAWIVEAYGDFVARHPGTRWDQLFYFQQYADSLAPESAYPLFFMHERRDAVPQRYKPGYYCYRALSHGLDPKADPRCMP